MKVLYEYLCVKSSDEILLHIQKYGFKWFVKLKIKILPRKSEKNIIIHFLLSYILPTLKWLFVGMPPALV